MPRAESKSLFPFSTIVPRAGVSSPAMQRRVMLLPEPDGPRMPSGLLPARKRTSRRKSLKRCSMSTSSSTLGLSPGRRSRPAIFAPGVHESDDDRRNANGDQDPRQSLPHLAGFGGEKDGDGERLGFAGNITGEHQRGSELAKGAGKSEHRACEDSRPGEWQRDFPENRPLGRAQRARSLGETG